MMLHKCILISIIAIILSSTAIHAFHVMAPYPGKIKNEIIKLPGSDRGKDLRFFFSVAFEGDILAIGAKVPNNNTSDDSLTRNVVYIFERTSSSANTWIERKKLTLSDEDVENQFGHSIAISGNTLIVNYIRGKNYDGTAYIYERNAGGSNNWGLVTKIIANVSMDNDGLGGYASPVAISKDTAVIGSRLDDDNGGRKSGSVYIYERNAGGSNNWGFVTKIRASDGASYDNFGISVAIENNTIVVGANGDDDNGPYSGSAYIFERSDSGWNEIVKLYSDNILRGDDFGNSVKISGDTIAISAPYHGRGSVYIFERLSNDIPNSWRQAAQIVSSDQKLYQLFGKHMAIDGNFLVVGSRLANDKGPRSGAAYFYERDQNNPNLWVERGKLNASDGKERDYFGNLVAISGDQAVIVSPGIIRPGAAYVFNLDSDSSSGESPTDTVGLVIEGSANTVGENITHLNGNVYTQVLLTGRSATLSQDGTEIIRISFLDINDDIVQVEFSGKATVTVTLDAETFVAAAPPIKYNQPSVNYVKGHPTIRVEGADENTFLSIFTVGSINAVNQALFPEGEEYDAMADVALLEITNSTGFGGILCANTRFSGSTGKVGIEAPGIPVSVRVLVGDINASGDAVPYLLFGRGSFWVAAPNSGLRITGGDLVQTNGASIVVAPNGFRRPEFDTLISQNNVKSDGTEQPTQSINATFVNEDGEEISVTVDEITIE